MKHIIDPHDTVALVIRYNKVSLTATMLRTAASRRPAGCATLCRGVTRASVGGIWLHASKLIVWTAGAAVGASGNVHPFLHVLVARHINIRSRRSTDLPSRRATCRAQTASRRPT